MSVKLWAVAVAVALFEQPVQNEDPNVLGYYTVPI
jgi:hypothetical protein